MRPMTKDEAIVLLGGSVAKAAEAIGVNSQAISQWPEVLSARLRDRVQAALWRMQQSHGRKSSAAPAKKAVPHG
jgi:transcriptional repressor of cell division inhibition gene dicB